MPKAKATKPRTINVHLPEETHRLLRTLSAQSGVTYAQVIASGLRLLEMQPGAPGPAVQELSGSTDSPPGNEGSGTSGFSSVEPADLPSEPADPHINLKGDTEPAPPPVVEDWMAELFDGV